MSTRYCPSCDLYTEWRGRVCEHDNQDHYAYMDRGRYCFDTLTIDHDCGGACDTVFPSDVGVTCCSITTTHHDLWVLLVRAMEREAEEGVFTVETWAPNFPIRAFRLVAMSKERAATALAAKLPPVLVGVVLAYFM